MADTPQDVQQKMRKLRENYLVRLAMWKSDLENVLRKPSWNANETEDLRNLAHNLAGSGGTYGFSDISQAAKNLENGILANDKQGILRDDLEKLITTCGQALQNTPRSSVDNKEVSGITAGGKTDLPLLLVVDDDPDMLELVSTLLKDDAQVIGVDNTNDALKIIQSDKPQLVLLDDRMAKGGSGLEMLEKIQDKIEGDQLTVIMLTASDQPQQIIRGLAHGAVDYITKPFQPEVFIRKIKERLTRQQITVLIADDDEPVRELLAYKFRTAGWRVVLANDGATALTLMQSQPPGLALLDRMMPGQDGLLVLQKMQATPDLAHIPVIFLTAKHYDSDILEGLKMGAADYIVKPFNPEEVVVRCMRLLQQRK